MMPILFLQVARAAHGSVAGRTLRTLAAFSYWSYLISDHEAIVACAKNAIEILPDERESWADRLFAAAIVRQLSCERRVYLSCLPAVELTVLCDMVGHVSEQLGGTNKPAPAQVEVH